MFKSNYTYYNMTNKWYVLLPSYKLNWTKISLYISRAQMFTNHLCPRSGVAGGQILLLLLHCILPSWSRSPGTSCMILEPVTRKIEEDEEEGVHVIMCGICDWKFVNNKLCYYLQIFK